MAPYYYCHLHILNTYHLSAWLLQLSLTVLLVFYQSQGHSPMCRYSREKEENGMAFILEQVSLQRLEHLHRVLR